MYVDTYFMYVVLHWNYTLSGLDFISQSLFVERMSYDRLFDQKLTNAHKCINDTAKLCIHFFYVLLETITWWIDVVVYVYLTYDSQKSFSKQNSLFYTEMQ